jgi:hypothetical protein
MSGTLDEYKRLFREATVSDQVKLFRLHIVIYLAVNVIWIALNSMGSIKIDPLWAVYYSPVGWGILIVVHYWFYVKGAENLCKLREEMIEAKIN